VGGECRFGLAALVEDLCDLSLFGFGEFVPAAGSMTASARLSPERLVTLADADCVDVCT